MNVLLINHYVGSPVLGMEFRPYYLAKEWSKKGHSTLLVGANYSHLRKKNPKSLGFSKHEGLDYYWIKTPQYTGNGFKRAINIFSFALRLLWQSKKITTNFKPHVVIASSTHLFDIFPAWWIARRNKARLVFEIHDLWPLSLIEIGKMSKLHPFVIMVKLAEYATYKLADKVISILPNTWDHVKKFGIKKKNFAVVENGISLGVKSSPLPRTHQTTLNKLKKQGKFLVGYAGAHGVANALNYFIDAAAQLENKNIHIILVGDGQEKETLIRYANSLGVENITFLERVEKSAVHSFLTQMDALYVGTKKIDIYKYGVSLNKVFDYMQAKTPIISSINASNDLMVLANCGITVTGESSATIAKGILKIKSLDKKKRESMGRNGYNYLSIFHTYPKLADKFLKFLIS